MICPYCKNEPKSEFPTYLVCPECLGTKHIDEQDVREKIRRSSSILARLGNRISVSSPVGDDPFSCVFWWAHHDVMMLCEALIEHAEETKS